jgi:hypothetical protein
MNTKQEGTFHNNPPPQPPTSLTTVIGNKNMEPYSAKTNDHDWLKYYSMVKMQINIQIFGKTIFRK